VELVSVGFGVICTTGGKNYDRHVRHDNSPKEIPARAVGPYFSGIIGS